jgi:hypothetical protein
LLAADVAPDYLKSHGRRVADVMTREVISVSETADAGFKMAPRDVSHGVCVINRLITPVKFGMGLARD